MANQEPLTIKDLRASAREFALAESDHWEASLFGATDGKAVGTYLEKKFRVALSKSFILGDGNAAKGIDLPSVNVDIKTTSVRQPQSSCPFRSAEEKIYGLGYSLLVFVYDKTDNAKRKKAQLNFKHVIFIEKAHTADHQTTLGLRQIIANGANVDDVVAFFEDRRLPVSDIEAHSLAERVLREPPEVGCLTISNALQWRLQYSRAINEAEGLSGVQRWV